MTPYYQDDAVTIYCGDCRDVLKTLPDESANCCVTSPPYWGLRDYGTATWEGGDSGCDHKQGRNGAGRADGIVDERGQRNRDGAGGMGGDCAKCGAIRIDSQLGLETTPGEYVENLVGVFREVRRVLRDDGTLWLNLGDSYIAKATGAAGKGGALMEGGRQTQEVASNRPDKSCDGLKEKNLVGIPWRVAFALQSDGWYLRQDIIWHKPNPMPESVTDRCTKAHEYIFLLSKSARYHYDAEAIAEKAINAPPDGSATDSRKLAENGSGRHDAGRKANGQGFYRQNESRNKRSVWTVTTKPYSGAHFATFPPDLIRPCILAGCPKGGTVIDCFGGSGTTAYVAREHGRKSISIELNEEYIPLQTKRMAQDLLAL